MTYREEIESARDRLRRAEWGVTAGWWEVTADTHEPGREEYGIWSEEANGYVAENVGTELDVYYIVLTQPGFGAVAADLFDAFLNTLGQELNDDGDHEKCAVEHCRIAGVIRMARHVNGVEL